MKLVLKKITANDVKDGEYVLVCACRDVLRPDNPLAIFQQPCRLYVDDAGFLEEVVISV